MKQKAESFSKSAQLIQMFRDNLCSVVAMSGKTASEFTDALIAGGHLLIEDLPGTGKTVLAKTAAALIAAPEKRRRGTLIPKSGGRAAFRRIQFTPDLLPLDITGVDIFDPEKHAFTFSPGPVFGHVILADEINRAGPKVQSALLEVMAEQQVTVGGTTRLMDPFFMVIATQNPVDMSGTYPLPAAQEDRFMMKLSIGYPEVERETEMILQDPAEELYPHVKPVISMEQLLELRQLSREVHVEEKLAGAVAMMLKALREHSAVRLPVSPRGGIMLIKAAKAHALAAGRDYVTGQDVIDTAGPVLNHRLHIKESRSTAAQLIDRAVRKEINALEI